MKKGKKSGYGKGGKKGGYGYGDYYSDDYSYGGYYGGKKGGYGYGGYYGGKKGGYGYGPPPPGPPYGGKKGGYGYGGHYGPPPVPGYFWGKKGGYGYGPPPPGPPYGGKKGGYGYGGHYGPPPLPGYYGGKKGGYGFGGPVFGPPPPGFGYGGKKGGYGYGGHYGPPPFFGGKKGGYGYGPPPPGPHFGYGGYYGGKKGGYGSGGPGFGGPFWGPPGYGGHWPGSGGGYGHGYWGDDYYYDDCDDETTDPQTPSLVHHEDGSIGCFPENEDGTLEYHGQTSLSLLKFSYSMKTGEGVEVQEKAREVENIFAGILAEKLDCSKFSGHTSTHSRKLIEENRRLAIIAIDPEPADNIDSKYLLCFNSETKSLPLNQNDLNLPVYFISSSTALGSHCDQTCCNSNCHSISSAMTVYTDGENDHNDICELLASLHDYTGKYDGSIEGVISLGIDPSTSEANGMKCYPEDEGVQPPLSPVLAVNTQTEEQKSLADEFVFPFMALILVMVAIAMYVKKRRRDRRLVEEREEQMRLKAIEDARYLDDGFKDNQFYVDDHAYQSYGYGRATLNSVNVHKCKSAQCEICSRSSSTEFVPLDSVSKWIERRSVEDDEVPPPPPPEESSAAYESKAVYTNQRDLGPIRENEAYDEPGHIQIGHGKDTGSI